MTPYCKGGPCPQSGCLGFLACLNTPQDKRPTSIMPHTATPASWVACGSCIFSLGFLSSWQAAGSLNSILGDDTSLGCQMFALSK